MKNHEESKYFSYTSNPTLSGIEETHFNFKISNLFKKLLEKSEIFF